VVEGPVPQLAISTSTDPWQPRACVLCISVAQALLPVPSVTHSAILNPWLPRAGVLLLFSSTGTLACAPTRNQHLTPILGHLALAFRCFYSCPCLRNTQQNPRQAPIPAQSSCRSQQ